MRKGYVYVLSNPCMEGIVKIGRSIHGGRGRADTLYRNDTGVPMPFELEFEIMVDDCVAVEKAIHAAYKSKRVNKSREFFLRTPQQAAMWLMSHVIMQSGGEVARASSDPKMRKLREFTEHYDIELLAGSVATEMQDSSTLPLAELKKTVLGVLSNPYKHPPTATPPQPRKELH